MTKLDTDVTGVDSPGGAPAARRPTRIGRPTKLTPKLAQKLAQLVEELGHVEPAARLCGLPPATVHDWLNRGEDRHRDPQRRATRPYAEFAEAIDKALGAWEQKRLVNIQAAGNAKPELWAADAWRLERRWPDRYGRRDHVDVSATLTPYGRAAGW